MAPSLKRKRITREDLEQPSRSPTPSSASDASDSDAEDIQAAFRRAFEAKYKPLPTEPKRPKIEQPQPEDDEEESEEESDWSGIDSDEEQVEVVSYANTRNDHDRASKSELRAFMSSKPPSSSSILQKPSSTAKSKDDDDPSEASNLKHDLNLQKLIRDSNLLSSASSSRSGTSTPTLSTGAMATGALRHKSTDLALMSLGAKKSIHVQKSMPMALRKAIAAKSKKVDERRRKDAKEAGIILEKEVRVKKGGSAGSRDRGVGGPSVGRFKGGMLKLSRKDVADITGGGGSGGRGGKSRGRGRGGSGRGR